MGGFEASGRDPATDRAAALIRNLDGHKSEEPRIADPWERVGARLIDAGVWFAIAVVVSVAANIVDLRYFPEEQPVRGFDRQTFDAQRLHPLVSWGGLSAIAVLACLYETIPTAFRGRHPGKGRMKLMVVGPNGQTPSFGRATLRWVVCWLPFSAAFVAALGSLTSGWAFLFIPLQFAALAIPGAMFFDDGHRGLHDRIAGTMVLSER